MMRPVPNRSAMRLQADFRRARAWRSGAWAGSPASLLSCSRASASTAPRFDGSRAMFAANAVRLTDRGVFIDPPSQQLLSNSAFSRAAVGAIGFGGSLPLGWDATGGVTLSVIEIGTVDGRASIVVEAQYTNATPFDPLNPDDGTTIQISLEPNNGYTAGSTRTFTFSGDLTVLTRTNISLVRARIYGRNSSGVAVGDSLESAVLVATTGVATPFVVTTLLDSTAVTASPVITAVIRNGSTGVFRFRLTAAQLEAGSTATDWIATSAGVETRTNYYAYNTSSGVVIGTVGSGGQLPTGWSLGASTTAQVLALNTEVAGDITLRVTVTNATGAAIAGTVRTSPIAQASNPVAAPGQVWVSSVIARILADPNNAGPRVGITSRNSSTSSTGSGSNVIPASSVPVTAEVQQTMPANTAYVSTQLTFSAAANSTSVTDIRLYPSPRIERVTVVGATGLVSRAAEVVAINEPALFAGACHAVVEAEYRAMTPYATVFAVQFGSGHVLRLVAGDQVGAIVELAGTAVATLTRASAGATGAIRICASWSAGSISVSMPDLGGGGVLSTALAGFDPTTATNVWLGSVNGTKPAATAVRALSVQAGAITGNSLALRARQRWSPINFKTIEAVSNPGSIEDAPAFIGTAVEAPGASYSAYPTFTSNRYFRRSNGGAAMNDVLPSPITAPTLALITIINIDAVASITVSTAAGSIQGAATMSIPPLSFATFASTAGVWYYFQRSGDIFAPPAEVPTVSVYGPPNPLDPFRSIVDPPSYAQYHSIIDPPRAFASEMVKASNAWAVSGNRSEALRCLRGLRDWCAADYWRGPAGDSSSLTQISNQIGSTGMAYLLVRDCGAGTPADHAVIREWFRARTTAMITFYRSIIRQGFTGPQVWTGSNTARNNHSYSAGFAAVTAARILERGDFYDFGVYIFRNAIYDAATLPGATGSLIAELSRGSRALYYSSYALVFLVPLAIALQSFGIDVWGEQNGALLKMVNFVVPGIDDLTLIKAEQARLIALGNTGTSNNLIAADQESIGFTSFDEETGASNPNESRVHYTWHPYSRFSNAQIPWRPVWVSRVRAYDNQFNTNAGGGQVDLFPAPGVT